MAHRLGRRLGAALAALAAALGLAACSGTGAGGARLEVVAAFYPLAEAARQVGGPAVAVTDLTPSGVEPHDLELRPGDLARLRSADLVLYLGGGFQPAVEDAVAALPDRSSALDLLAELPLRTSAEDQAEADPHIWLDPLLMKRIVERVAGALGDRLPGERAAFRARALAYAPSLDDLHRAFERRLRSCERREIVTSHAAFGYLAARYGLRQIPLAGVSPEAEPTPRRLEEVARLVRERGVTTIFFETLASPRVAAALARAVGARTAVLDPIEGLTEEARSRGEDYLSLMRANLEALAEGLGCAG